jgi:hypothetical protein
MRWQKAQKGSAGGTALGSSTDTTGKKQEKFMGSPGSLVQGRDLEGSERTSLAQNGSGGGTAQLITLP